MKKRLAPGEVTVLLNVKMPESWIEALRKLADEENTVSSLVRDAIRRFLKQNGMEV